MRFRPYVHSHDFEAISGWVTDERTHAMWCANHIQFPMEKEAFGMLLCVMFSKFGDCPFVATTDDGQIIGFICCSLNYDSNEAMLAFVLVDPKQRGKGIGKEMIQLAAKYCFEIFKADLVQLNVFTANEPARRCYESAGFTERNTTPDAFTYKDESWGRCNMTITRDKLPICR